MVSPFLNINTSLIEEEMRINEKKRNEDKNINMLKNNVMYISQKPPSSYWF